MLSQWTRQAEKCGLKLIEAPVEQTPLSAEENPFQSVIYIPLSLLPPTLEELRILLEDEFIEIPSQLFEIEFLKKMDFIIDIESDILLQDLNVDYSFSKTHYKNTQLIHKSGCAFIQINEGFGFHWITNRLLLTSSANIMGNSKINQLTNPSLVRKNVEAYCKDVEWLKSFYEKVSLDWKSSRVKIYNGSIYTISSEESVDFKN